jgi:hypothetical protein
MHQHLLAKWVILLVLETSLFLLYTRRRAPACLPGIWLAWLVWRRDWS